MRRRERSLSFAADSPFLAGHFPGNPVVPAVVMLAELIDWTESEVGRTVVGVDSSRFRKPLKPDEAWSVALEEHSTQSVRIVARDGDRVVMQARLSLESG